MSDADRAQICESYKGYYNQKYIVPETICAYAGVSKILSAENFGDKNPTATCDNTVQLCNENPDLYKKDYQYSLIDNICILPLFTDGLKPCSLTISELEQCIPLPLRNSGNGTRKERYVPLGDEERSDGGGRQDIPLKIRAA